MADKEDHRLDIGTLLTIQAAVLVIALVGMDITDTTARNEIPTWTAIVMGTGAGILSYTLLFIITRLPLPGLESVRDGLRLMLSLLGDLGYVKILVISAGAAISEEFLFRLFLQGWISDIASPGVGIVVGAILFGLLHAISVAYVVGTFVIGLAIGALYEWTGSALLVIVWHFAYDVLAFLVATKKPEWIGLERIAEP